MDIRAGAPESGSATLHEKDDVAGGELVITTVTTGMPDRHGAFFGLWSVRFPPVLVRTFGLWSVRFPPALVRTARRLPVEALG